MARTGYGEGLGEWDTWSVPATARFSAQQCSAREAAVLDGPR